MPMKRRVTVILIITAIVGILAAAGVIVFKKFAPSYTQRPMSEQYKLGEDEALIILNGKPVEERGRLINNNVYIPVSLATASMNERIYWDDRENILSLATPAGLITVDAADSMHYTLGKQSEPTEFQLLYQDGDVTYVAMDFVSGHSRINYAWEKEPNRMIVQADFQQVNTFASLADAVRLRVGPNKKYDYLLELTGGQEVLVDTGAPPENDYQKIITLDGIEGYVPVEYLKETEEKAWTTDKPEDVFEQISLGQKVCLGWHQMTYEGGTADMTAKVSQASCLNVISPTWFALSDNKGNFSSLATEEYVTAAHAKGLKVWGLVNDFSEKISLKRILGRTSVRTTLVNNLVAAAIQYKLDGINVDFEKITKETAPAYLEFLRELVLQCHANGIIVSVDDYLPTEGTSYYNWAEQGRVADYVIFMAYDEHYAGSETCGSVSSLPFVNNGVDLGLQHVPKERTVVALPFYTRRWKTKKGDKVVGKPDVYGMNSAEIMLQNNEASKAWDDATGQYYSEFRYQGYTYKIWLEEETSLEKKLETVFAKEVAGVAFWKLGFERPVTWTMIEKFTKQ